MLMRELLSELEGIKNSILELWTKHPALEENMRPFYASDAKEAYYNSVLAWELLERSNGDESRAQKAQAMLDEAASRVHQVDSELMGQLRSNDSERLDHALRDCFGRFRHAMDSALAKKLVKERPAPVPPESRIRKLGASEYVLFCAVCSADAMRFRIGIPGAGKEPALCYSGATKTTSLHLSAAEPMFEHFDADDLSGAHEFVRSLSHIAEGLDAYCPNCDRTYCREHWTIDEKFDDGFYDRTHGTCPKGHRRTLDD